MTMSNYYKVVIIDDENASAKALVKELSRYPRFHVDGVAHDAESGKDMIMRIMPDLLFLDVELPEMYGMELLAEIKDSVNWSMRVVFYTAHDKYLINALRNSAFDFLLKPIDKKEFEVVISRFLLDYESKTSLFDKHEIINADNKESSFMVVLPTGGGKTYTASVWLLAGAAALAGAVWQTVEFVKRMGGNVDEINIGTIV